jgi:subtilisin family serine protease
VALGVGVVGAGAQERPSTAIDEAGWQGVLGVRAQVSTAQRYVVLLRPPSLAARVKANGGEASEKEMVDWSSAAVAQQEQFLARLSAVGARIAPEYRYTKVVNGFSARLDPTSLSLLDDDREVTGIFPVRIAYPAQAIGEGGVLPAAVADLEVAGLDGSGVTVAILDTGVDPSHPYLRGRVQSGIDILNPGSGGIAQPHPTIPGRPSSPGSSPGPRAPTGFTASRRARRSSPSAWEAGSRTPKAATASTRGPTRSWPASRRRSIPTTTATRTTRRGSR